MTIGQRLKIARQAAGMTQYDLETATGIKRQYLCYLENGKKNSSLKTLQLIADGLGVSIVALVTDEHHKSISRIRQYQVRLKMAKKAHKDALKKLEELIKAVKPILARKEK